MKKNILFICAILVMAGCGKNGSKAEKDPIAVETMKVGESSVNGAQTFSGTIEENDGVSASFATSGTLKTLNVREGQTISKGQLIGVIDATSARNSYAASQSSVATAKSTLATARDNYNRSKMLHDRNSLAEQKWVQAKEQLRQAEEQVRLAQSMGNISAKSLSDYRLYAPIGGYVSTKYVEAGQNVVQGQPVCKIVNINQVKVKIAVPETEISRIRQGQPVEFTVSALPGRVFHGRVAEKAVTADAQSRSYEVKAIVDNRDHALLPGMVCDLTVSYTSGGDAIFLHANVVQLDSDNRYFVWTVQNGKAHKTYITTGEETAQGVMVTSGLRNGDTVIIGGQQKVSEGSKVSF